ncbi:MAG: peptide deformylase [Aurantimicrobium sp.]|jgi:peptide deformylase|nr:peptide deformylase [Aurantimicrobium sp.]
MAIRPIVIRGEAVLHEPAVPVTAFDADLRDLIRDMFDTMDAAPGVGLAAPQIGVGLRVFVYDYPHDDGTERRGAVVNPELFVSPVDVREPTEADDEGCLSFPGERYALVRSEETILRACDETGAAFSLECDGWFARIMQHEFDHLNGVMFVDRLDAIQAYDAAKVEKKRGWGVPGKTWLPGVDHLED